MLATCFGNVLESPGKLFVEKSLFLFERLSFDKFFGKMNIWKIVGTILERFNPLCGERPINNNRRMFLNIRLRQLTNRTIVKKKTCDEHDQIQQMQLNFLNIIRQQLMLQDLFCLRSQEFVALSLRLSFVINSKQILE